MRPWQRGKFLVPGPGPLKHPIGNPSIPKHIPNMSQTGPKCMSQHGTDLDENDAFLASRRVDDLGPVEVHDHVVLVLLRARKQVASVLQPGLGGIEHVQPGAAQVAKHL